MGQGHESVIVLFVTYDKKTTLDSTLAPSAMPLVFFLWFPYNSCVDLEDTKTQTLIHAEVFISVLHD